MEGNPFTQFVFQIFLFCAIVIIGYTCNFYYLAFLSSRRKDENSVSEIGEPTITTQLPIYNERYVATRLVDAVCAQDYSKEKMKIMVLDDSDDETVNMMHKTVLKYQSQGFDISHVRRGTRAGYKAGALKHAMKSTKSDFVAIFDADFIPPNWYLKKAIPHFTNAKIGLVQCR